jgi:prepilin-type N-terminal cleavage/methylation domain-containing protein
MRAQVRKAFTLVEILIVVVILGILAAIVVPQFTNATQDAQQGNIQAQLETLNNQIELFRARHSGLPRLANGDLDSAWVEANLWDFLIAGGTLPDGKVVEGGYIKAAPRHPRFSDRAQATALIEGAPAPDGSGGGSAVAGWHFWEDVNGNFHLGASYFNEDTGTLDPDEP